MESNRKKIFEFFFLFRNFKKALNDVILSRRAINNMNTLYPDATAEELSQSDSICIICRYEFDGKNDQMKILKIFSSRQSERTWFIVRKNYPVATYSTPPVYDRGSSDSKRVPPAG